mmetsp:Transcript_12327/g.30169  ORF Transcript_12327/g.30169 Transcript_12327/m.30169 type:complete len:213 (+) Transcript_12327:1157-1795(+)
MPSSGTSSCSSARMPSTGRQAFWFLMGLTNTCVAERMPPSLSPATNMMDSLDASRMRALLSPSFSISSGRHASHAPWMSLPPVPAEHASIRAEKAASEPRYTLATLSFIARFTVLTSVLNALCWPTRLGSWPTRYVSAASRSCQFLEKNARATYSPASSCSASASLAVAPASGSGAGRSPGHPEGAGMSDTVLLLGRAPPRPASACESFSGV